MDLDLCIAFRIGHNQFVAEFIIDNCSDLTSSAGNASVSATAIGEACHAWTISDSLINYIIYGHTSWLRIFLSSAKPEECNLCVTDWCH